mgnify:CR=1 FL=1
MSDQPTNIVIKGDCLVVLQGLAACSFDSIVTDPPAGIAFMGKDWDDPEKWKYPITKHGFTDGGDRVPAPSIGAAARNPNCRNCKRHKRGWKNVPGCSCDEPDFDDQQSHRESRDKFIAWLRLVMVECLRVLKPGGHALVWAIPRTSHWTAMAIEEAGFEIRDSILHVFGQGFPKGLNISKAIDKAKGAERKVVKKGRGFDPKKNKAGQFDSISPSNVGINTESFNAKIGEVTEPATPEAQRWDGWGTQLKPAVEIWWLCRKPIEEETIVAQVLETGTGAINIGGCRIHSGPSEGGATSGETAFGQGSGWNPHENRETDIDRTMSQGRWPANIVFSHGPGCRKVGTRSVDAPVINRFTDGMKPFGDGAGHPYETVGGGTEEQAVYECQPGCPVGGLDPQSGELTSGRLPSYTGENRQNTSIFAGGGVFSHQGYEAEAGGASRFFQVFEPDYEEPFVYTGKASKRDKNTDLAALNAAEESLLNKHPTVKSQALMTYLVRLITPKGGKVLDPFAGSGSTLVAAATGGFLFLGIEREDEYWHIAKTRTDKALYRVQTEAQQRSAFEGMAELPEDAPSSCPPGRAASSRGRGIKC